MKLQDVMEFFDQNPGQLEAFVTRRSLDIGRALAAEPIASAEIVAAQPIMIADALASEPIGAAEIAAAEPTMLANALAGTPSGMKEIAAALGRASKRS
ncbi:MAG: hypothetical protein ABSH28_00485 [Acidobacteriota bacterium]|jgi:hypothetical protein